MEPIDTRPVEQSKFDSVGISGNLSVLANRLVNAKEVLEKKKQELEELQKSYDETSTQLMCATEALGLDSFNSLGYTFYLNTKESVRIPKTDEDKQAFFQYLKEQGLFEKMISINSVTLNSLYKAMSHEALEKGILDYRMPGIDEPITYKQLRIRKQ